MKKIIFENAPSKATPLNAENLNMLQTNVEEEVNRIETNTTRIDNEVKRIDNEVKRIDNEVKSLEAIELFRGRKASYEILSIPNIKQYVRLELTFAPYTFQQTGNTGGTGNVLTLDLTGGTDRCRAGTFIPYYARDPFTERINKESAMFWCLAEADIPGNRLVALVSINNEVNVDAKGYALTRVVGYKKI